jgi:viroplasmin and RNaseH domain-containing protein
LVRDESTKTVWELTDRAVNWLKINTYENKILKWNTEEWGEIKLTLVGSNFMRNKYQSALNANIFPSR